jgi:hypothetical protein
MHAVVVRATIHDPGRTREVLDSQVVPQASGAPGFKAGYWTWPTGEGELNVLAMIIFDSKENARAAGERVSANFSQLEKRDDSRSTALRSARSSQRPDELGYGHPLSRRIAP